jgi:hypothetical protein
MQRKHALQPRNTLDARLWSRLREMREQGWHFRKGAPSRPSRSISSNTRRGW